MHCRCAIDNSAPKVDFFSLNEPSTTRNTNFSSTIARSDCSGLKPGDGNTIVVPCSIAAHIEMTIPNAWNRGTCTHIL